MTIHVEYYAALREARGLSAETLECDSTDPANLYAQLCERHGLRFTPEQLRVVVNEAFVDWRHTLKDGDTVVFIPPVAGG